MFCLTSSFEPFTTMKDSSLKFWKTFSTLPWFWLTSEENWFCQGLIIYWPSSCISDSGSKKKKLSLSKTNLNSSGFGALLSCTYFSSHFKLTALFEWVWEIKSKVYLLEQTINILLSDSFCLTIFDGMFTIWAPSIFSISFEALALYSFGKFVITKSTIWFWSWDSGDS